MREDQIKTPEGSHTQGLLDLGGYHPHPYKSTKNSGLPSPLQALDVEFPGQGSQFRVTGD